MMTCTSFTGSPGRLVAWGAFVALLVNVSLVSGQSDAYVALMSNDTLINADIWDEEPKIFTANYAFEGIQGVEGTTKEAIEAAGGTWIDNVPEACSTIVNPVRTTAQTPSGVANLFGYPTYYADAMPIVFSWPVKVSTVGPGDFQLTLNTGEVVYPEVASIAPNLEWNERSTVVVFGEFGNRISPDKPGAVYVEKVEIVDDGTPLMLVGTGGKLFNAVGLSYNASCCIPYGPGAKGPTLVAAKLSYFSDEGEYTAADGGAAQYPNSCSDLYGEEVQYRLRMYTSGGFSPDGVSPLLPDSYEDFFRVHVSVGEGKTMTLDKVGEDYVVPGAGSLKVLGLADLGVLKASGYDACWFSDADNYIDVCMVGSEAAARRIVALEIPSSEAGNTTSESAYQPLYNPGGPGTNPAQGVNYTSPSPYTYQTVRIALDDTMTVTVYDTMGGDQSWASRCVTTTMTGLLLLLSVL